TSRRATIFSPSAPSTPRLRMEPTGSRRGPLDGGWWPRSTHPRAELPGLVLAIDHLRGPVRQLILNAQGWDSHPRRLGVAGRVIRPGSFASQPPPLLRDARGGDASTCASSHQTPRDGSPKRRCSSPPRPTTCSRRRTSCWPPALLIQVQPTVCPKTYGKPTADA